eukprot:12100961-Alexandrium_andersonii.AAC.1
MATVFPSDQAGRGRCINFLHQRAGREDAAAGCLVAVIDADGSTLASLASGLSALAPGGRLRALASVP